MLGEAHSRSTRTAAVTAIAARCLVALGALANATPGRGRGAGAGTMDDRLKSCRDDSFGLAQSGASVTQIYEKGIEDFTCEFKFTDAAKFEKFTLNYYPNIKQFANFNGTDMVPERHYEFADGPLVGGLRKWIPGTNGPVGQTERLRIGECTIPQADGGAYSIQKVGPLVSSGDYDYWQFGWQDVWRLSEVLKDHPDGVMFSSSFSGPVDPRGKVIGHPPIHIHHIHITPAPGVVTKMDKNPCLGGLKPEECYITNLVVEQHGDYQCTEADGGIDCFFEKVADGYGKVVTHQLDLEGEINDVRAANSEPMTWWYQIVLRWFPRTTKLKPLSQWFNVGPGQFNRLDQRHNVWVFPVNATTKSLYWYSGRMQHDGRMVRNKLHSHNTIYHSAYWFRAEPEDLGLTADRFWPALSYRPTPLDELGFDDYPDVLNLVLDNLAKAAERWDRVCPPSRPECLDRRPSLICESWVENEDFLDPASGKVFAYDRRAPCCCRPWRFYKDDIFTAVSFMAPMKTPPGPWSPHKIPPFANMHVHWLMTFETDDKISHYGQTMYCQNPDKQFAMPTYPWHPSTVSWFPAWRMIEALSYGNGGLNNMPMTTVQRVVLAFKWCSLFLSPFAYGREVFALVVWVFFVFAMLFIHMAFHCRRAKRIADHPVVACAQGVPCCTEEAVNLAVGAVRASEALQHGD